MSAGMLFLKVYHLASRVSIFVGSTAGGFTVFYDGNAYSAIAVARWTRGCVEFNAWNVSCEMC